MGLLAIGVLGTYLTMLFVVQQAILARHDVQNTRSVEPPLRHILFILSSVVLPFGAATMPRQIDITFPVMRVSGIVITLLGFILSMWAQQTLGRNWVGGIGLHRRHHLITTGPYKHVRHPLYAGILLSCIGIGVFSLNPLFMLGCTLFAGAYAIRALGEEIVLKKEFKLKYENYQARTGAIIPRIRKRG